MSEPLDWFPFYVNRFRNSRRVRRMTAQEVGVYILMMCEQWDGGPIPDEDFLLARFGQCDASIARKVLDECFNKTDAGWVNPELLEIQEEQETKRQRYKDAGRAGGLAKAAKKASDATATPEQRSTIREEKSKKETTTSYSDEFEDFWNTYPKRKGSNSKKKAHAAWRSALKAGATRERVMDGARRYREFCDSENKTGTQFVAMAATWLNQERWDDELEGETPNNGNERHINLMSWDPAA